MITRILDTSVAIAWYLPETFSEEARYWRSQLILNRVRFLVPSLHFLETANVLKTYVSRGELSEALALEIYDTHLEAGLHVVRPSLDQILGTALEYESTAYDGAYISLAIHHQVPLLTGERTTTPWVVKLGDLVETIG